MRFENFLGRSPELVPEPRFACKCYTKHPPKRGLRNKVRTPSQKILEPHFLQFGLPELLLRTFNIETFLARTAWSQRKLRNLAKSCAKRVHAHSRKLRPKLPLTFCANCAGAPPHKFRTISTHFWMPPHIFRTNSLVGCTPKGAYSTRGRSRHLLETPLLRTPSENPSQNPFLL